MELKQLTNILRITDKNGTMHEADKGQGFYVTPKTYELWEIPELGGKTLQFLKRWNRKSIFWIHEKERR